MGCIYKITNKINGKCYIGQTMKNDPVDRWKSHCSKKTDSAIHLAIVKYGKNNFTLEVIDNTNTIDELNQLEIMYIKQFNSFYPNGYNLDEGGRNCVKSKESIEKGAIKKRGKPYKNRRRGIVAIHSETGHIIETEVVKDFLTYGFNKNDMSNIRWCLTGKSKSGKKRVKKYYFCYRTHVNQRLIEEIKTSSAPQRIVTDPDFKIRLYCHQETQAPTNVG